MEGQNSAIQTDQSLVFLWSNHHELELSLKSTTPQLKNVYIKVRIEETTIQLVLTMMWKRKLALNKLRSNLLPKYCSQ